MAIKKVDQEVQSSRGFQMIRFKFIDTKTKRTWWGEWGDLSKREELKTPQKKGLKIKTA